MTAVFTFPALSGNLTLKQRANAVFAVGVIVSVLVHLALLSLFPRFSVAYSSPDRSIDPLLEIVNQVELPPPPDEVVRPAIPIMSTQIGLVEDITIAPMRFEDIPRTVQLPQLPGNVEASTDRAWVPYEVAPRIQNRDAYVRAVQSAYPLMLRNARIGGTVVLAVLLDERGNAIRIEVEQSSGHQDMDSVAVRVTRDVARFTPALSRDQPLSVWIRLPVTFTAP